MHIIYNAPLITNQNEYETDLPLSKPYFSKVNNNYRNLLRNLEI